MIEEVLVTDQLTVHIDGMLLLEGVDIQAFQGDFIAIVGEEQNSMMAFLQLISGHLKPTHGMVLYKGSDISTLDPLIRIRLGIGSSFWDGAIEPRLSLLENVKWAVQNTLGVRNQLIRHFKNYNDSEQKAYEYLHQVGLNGKYHLLAETIPEGEKRRLELAVALAFDPDLLLLYEPTKGMNPDEAEEMVTILQEIKATREKTILMVEGRRSVVKQLADRVAFFDKGGMIGEGTPDFNYIQR